MALIGVDWGTSSLRCRALDADGRALDGIDSDRGILTITDGDFDTVLAGLIGRWQRTDPVPVVLSGMITSRNGWLETPYLRVPCAPADLAGALERSTSRAGWPLAFVAGVCQHPDAPGEACGDGANDLPPRRHDVMRGEETELLGRLRASGAEAGWFVLPGTHSKWVRLAGGAIVWFRTFMTGELYAALSAHTILGRLMDPAAPFDEAGFDAGVRAQAHAGASLAGELFTVRAMPLLQAMAPAAARDYLAGLLIGAECREALDLGAAAPTLIGRGDLVTRYRRALHLLGCHSDTAEPGSAARGHWEIARVAGLTSPSSGVMT